MLPPDVFSQPENAQKCVGGDSAGGAYSAPPDLAGLRGPTSKGRGGKVSGEEGKGGRKGRGGERRGGEERKGGGEGNAPPF